MRQAVSQSIGALDGNGSVNLGSATLATRVDTSATFGGAMSGLGGGLTKQGGGTLTTFSATLWRSIRPYCLRSAGV